MVDGLLEVARTLINHNKKAKPKQAYLRRGVSTAYYALHHAMARSAADVMIGTVVKKRPNRAWAQVCRGMDHGPSKNACIEIRGAHAFPPSIRSCADAYVELQHARHEADYDPLRKFTRAEAITILAKAEAAIKLLQSAPPQDRAAFGVHLLIKRR
jgi:uncharacterized protein (UPF0332 family)